MVCVVNTYVCVRVLVLYVLYGCKRSEAIKSPSPCYLLLRGKCLAVAGDVGDGWVAGAEGGWVVGGGLGEGGEGGLRQEWGVPESRPRIGQGCSGEGQKLCPSLPLLDG